MRIFKEPKEAKIISELAGEIVFRLSSPNKRDACDASQCFQYSQCPVSEEELMTKQYLLIDANVTTFRRQIMSMGIGNYQCVCVSPL